MRRTFVLHALAMLAMTTGLATAACADVRITEIMFEGKGLDTVEFKKDGVTPNPKVIDDKREFFEITNLGTSAVDIQNWVYDDDKAGDAHAFGSLFGTLAAGESLVFTEMAVEDFRSLWNLDASVKIYSLDGLSNLGKNDTIFIYDANNAIVDSVTYPVGLDASGVSYNRPTDLTGSVPTTDAWLRSSVGDAFGTTQSDDLPLTDYSTYENGVLVPHTETVARFDVANPGHYPVAATAAVPEPASWAMMIAGLGGVGFAMRRQRTARLRFA